MGQGKGRRVPVEIPRIRKLRWCLTDVHWRWSDRRRCVQGNDLFPFESPPLFRSRLQQQHLLYLLLNSSLGFGRSSLKIESGIEGSRTWCRDRCLESAQGNECFLFSARTIRGIYYTYIYILSNYQHVHMLDICCPSDHFFCFFLKLLLWTYAYRLWTSCGGWSNGRGMHSGQACSHHNSEKPWYDGLTPQKQNFGTFKIDCPEKRDGQ